MIAGMVMKDETGVLRVSGPAVGCYSTYCRMNLMEAGMMMRQRGTLLSHGVQVLHNVLPNGHGENSRSNKAALEARCPIRLENDDYDSVPKPSRTERFAGFPVLTLSDAGACSGPHTAATDTFTHAYIQDEQGRQDNEDTGSTAY